jgi:hypothetical protein
MKDNLTGDDIKRVKALIDSLDLDINDIDLIDKILFRDELGKMPPRHIVEAVVQLRILEKRKVDMRWRKWLK